MQTPLAIPTVHLNGTSKERLVEEYTAQYNAVSAALKVCDASHILNARDYYHQGEGVYAIAAEQHKARLALLQQVRDQLYTILETIIG